MVCQARVLLVEARILLIEVGILLIETSVLFIETCVDLLLPSGKAFVQPLLLRRKASIQALVQVVPGDQGIHIENKCFRHQFSLRLRLGLGYAHLF